MRSEDCSYRYRAGESFKRLAVISFCSLALIQLIAQEEPKPPVVIEDFEAELTEAPAVKTGWESNGGSFSTAKITRTTDVKNGVGAGQIVFDVKPSGWALVQKKIEGAEWLKMGPKAVSFWLKGGGAGSVTVELEESYRFKWRKEVSLADKSWHLVTLKFSEFLCPEKAEMMSVADLVAIKFVCFSGTPKFQVDDINVDFTE